MISRAHKGPAYNQMEWRQRERHQDCGHAIRRFIDTNSVIRSGHALTPTTRPTILFARRDLTTELLAAQSSPCGCRRRQARHPRARFLAQKASFELLMDVRTSTAARSKAWGTFLAHADRARPRSPVALHLRP